MCNFMLSYFKRNQEVQRNKRQRRSERDDPSRSEQADQSMSGEIILEHIRDVSSISQQTELRVIIRLKQSGVKASGEKRGRSERSEKITEIEKIRVKRENKSVVRRSDRIVRKLVWRRVEKAVQYITTHSQEKIQSDMVDKKRRRSTQNNLSVRL